MPTFLASPQIILKSRKEAILEKGMVYHSLLGGNLNVDHLYLEIEKLPDVRLWEGDVRYEGGALNTWRLHAIHKDETTFFEERTSRSKNNLYRIFN